MVLSRIRSLFGFSIFASIGLALCTAAATVSGFLREVITEAFPVRPPALLMRTVPTPAAVLGRPAALSFRDSLLSRQGDGRQRSPLSVAFVT